MSSPTVVWSGVAGFDGQVTWIPEDLEAVPANCVCGALLQVTERANADERPIALTCDGGHRWRATIDLLEERLAAKSAADADRPRCTGCRQFLSAVRVQMRIDRCAKCDRTRGRAAR